MLDQPKKTETPMSVGDWVLTIFLTSIPIVGIVLLFVWAFGSSAPQTKANYSKAMLIWFLIAIVLYAIVLALFGSFFFAAMNGMENSY